MADRAGLAAELIDASVTLGGNLILERVTMHVHHGTITCVTGPSGCGKTTLLRLIAGLVTPSDGIVMQRTSQIGVVFQEPRLLPWLTAAENVATGMAAAGLSRRDRLQSAAKLLALSGLGADAASAYPNALSGGMASRVAFARALAMQPSLLLCDEPFVALDAERRAAMQDLLLRQVSEHGTAVVIVTHDSAEAERLAHVTYNFGAHGSSFRLYGTVMD